MSTAIRVAYPMSCYDPVTTCGNDRKIIQADEPHRNDYEVNNVHREEYTSSYLLLLVFTKDNLPSFLASKSHKKLRDVTRQPDMF